ncbi:hypothetical protein T484DRAFT_1867010 [Baffinella frigidus]|nr:hypothetical protein T484DRAFT_1867010 [Cryptophyta sp. CCMP2293]
MVQSKSVRALGVLLRAGKLCDKDKVKADKILAKAEQKRLKNDKILAQAEEKRLNKFTKDENTRLKKQLVLKVKNDKILAKMEQQRLNQIAFEIRTNANKERLLAIAELRATQRAEKTSSKKSRTKSADKPIHDVDLPTPYCVRAAAPIYEEYMACSTKVDAVAVSVYIDEAYIQDAVKAIQCGTTEDYTRCNAYIQNEYGPLFKTCMLGNFRTGMTDKVIKRVWHIEKAFIVLAGMPCQDTRCIVTGRTVIEPDRFVDEINGDLKCFLRRGRGFTVHDPLTFNAFFRELRRSHPTVKVS